MEGEGRVARQVGAHGYFAVVRLRINLGSPGPVIVEPTAISDYDQGSGWGEAAMIGAGFGMSLAEAVGMCAVTHVRGMVCDTSPALVAVAAIRAVWAATEFLPSTELSRRIESCVLQGHKLLPEQLRPILIGDS